MLDFNSLLPYLKALLPALLALLSAVVTSLVTGTWDLINLEILSVGLASAFVTLIISGDRAKGIVPILITLVGVGIHYLFTGEWNPTETAAAITGLMAGLVALLVPNFGTVKVLPRGTELKGGPSYVAQGEEYR